MTLQPHGQQQGPELKIIWGALNASLLMYGGMLVLTQKVTGLWFPGFSMTMMQEMSLLSCLMFLITFTIYRKKVLTTQPLQLRYPFMIVCWALNEAPAILGFVVTFVGSDGNAFFYVVNAALAFLMNLVMFPKK